MGQEVHEAAQAQMLPVSSIVDPYSEKSTHKTIDKDSLCDTDVCICFTTPQVAIENIEMIASYKKNIVMATTGWHDKAAYVKEIIKKHDVGMIYSGNFSIGVNIFFSLLKNATQIINSFHEYDVLGYELHHNTKIDSPSGTAKILSQIVLENIDRKTCVFEDKYERKPNTNEFHMASIRGGNIPGTHAIQFDSEFDNIELKHTARSRKGFAIGSLLAARWIHQKKGFFFRK